MLIKLGQVLGGDLDEHRDLPVVHLLLLLGSNRQPVRGGLWNKQASNMHLADSPN